MFVFAVIFVFPCSGYANADGVGSFRFRFPGTGYLAFRFVGAYGSVRFVVKYQVKRFGSVWFLICTMYWACIFDFSRG